MPRFLRNAVAGSDATKGDSQEEGHPIPAVWAPVQPFGYGQQANTEPPPQGQIPAKTRAKSNPPSSAIALSSPQPRKKAAPDSHRHPAPHSIEGSLPNTESSRAAAKAPVTGSAGSAANGTRAGTPWAACHTASGRVPRGSALPLSTIPGPLPSARRTAQS